MKKPEHIVEIERLLDQLVSDIKKQCSTIEGNGQVDTLLTEKLSDTAVRLHYLAEERDGYVRCEEFVAGLESVPEYEGPKRGRRRKSGPASAPK